MWIDIHAHLYDLTADELCRCIERARAGRVTAIVNTPTGIETSRTVAAQCAATPALFGVAGVSAFDVDLLAEGWEDELRQLLRRERIIGIGEIGIDKTNPRYPPFDTQCAVFDRQLAMARELDVPAIIHSRGAEREAIEMCAGRRIEKAVFHCFTGARDTLQLLLDAGYYASFSGIVTFAHNPLDALIERTPLTQLFIETDAPYLAPAPYRGKRNEPAFLPRIGENIARKKKVSPAALAAAVRNNFTALFGVSVFEQ